MVKLVSLSPHLLCLYRRSPRMHRNIPQSRSSSYFRWEQAARRTSSCARLPIASLQR